MGMEYLLLGFLNRGELSGYDLHKQIGDAFEKGWNADRRQIYYLLHKMEKNGWLEVEVIPQEDHPTKKVYHITTAGQEALKTWIKTPMKGETAPFDWMGQLYLGYEVELRDVINVLEHRQAHLEERLATGIMYLEENEQARAAGVEISPRLVFGVLNLHHGFTYTISELQWVRQAIEQLQALDANTISQTDLTDELLTLLRNMITALD